MLPGFALAFRASASVTIAVPAACGMCVSCRTFEERRMILAGASRALENFP